MRAREQWRQLGGEELLLVPSLTAEPAWVRALARWIQQARVTAAPYPPGARLL
jgi:hypothetical protein